MSLDCFCDYDPPEFWSRRIVTARKSHKCDECRGVILPKEKYEYTAGKWDGYLDQFHTCERCHDIRVWVENNLPCFCWAHGNMLDDAREAVNEAYWRAPEEAAGLRFGLGRRIVLLNRHNQKNFSASRAEAVA